MQTLHGKGSTGFENTDSTLHSIISCSGLDIFVLINCILAKICRWKLGVPLIMEHRVVYSVQTCYCVIWCVVKRRITRLHFSQRQTTRKQHTKTCLLLLWLWSWPGDLDIWIWARYSGQRI